MCLAAKTTFCNPFMGSVIVESIRHRNDTQVWFCSLALLMPDHIHLILNFPPQHATFSGIVIRWKHWLSHQYSISWQENFFDHRLREGENTDDKVLYILQNPVRAGLVEKLEQWPYVFIAD